MNSNKIISLTVFQDKNYYILKNTVLLKGWGGTWLPASEKAGVLSLEISVSIQNPFFFLKHRDPRCKTTIVF